MQVIILLLIGIPLSILNSFVSMKLWAWFIMPVFNAPVLHMIYAYGIMLIVSMFQVIDTTKNTTIEENIKNFISYPLRALLILFFGYCATFFM